MAEPSSSWWPSLYRSDSTKQADLSSKATPSGTSPPANSKKETNTQKASTDARYNSTKIDGKTATKDSVSKSALLGGRNENGLLDGDLGPAQNTSSLLSYYFQWGYPNNSERSLEEPTQDKTQVTKDTGPKTSEPGHTQLQSSWWWSTTQNVADENSTGANETDQANHVLDSNERGQSWFSWFWSIPENASDVDLDPSVQHTKRLFSEAQSAIETPKGSTCNYAIFNVFGERNCVLAVEGTKSEEHPVAFDIEKKPILPNESFELGISYAKSSQETKNVKPPSAVQTSASQAQENNDNSDHLQNPQTDSSNENYNGDVQDSNSTPNELKLNGRSSSTEPSNTRDTRARERLDTENESASPSTVPTVLPVLDRNLRKVTLTTKARLWGEALIYGDKTSEKHIYKSTRQSLAKKRESLAKKVVIISTHSFLPIKFVKSFIGQGTGNATDFASSGAESILRWKKILPSNVPSENILDELKASECTIHTISLEGIGTIKDRVDSSLKLLRNWSDEIRSADSVLFVSNSIACPVNAFLLDEMHKHNVEFKLKDKKVGILNMAGVNTGIFPDIDSKTVRRAYTSDENNILREVFELQSEKSGISQELSSCLKRLCHLNVKFTYCGGVNDQFVPVYSACANTIKHPNMFKCLYVSPESDIPAFVIRLMSIILTMENVGHYDETLLNDLSDLVQGPITSSGSHGSIFDSPEVYDTAVRFAFETTSLKHQKLPQTAEGSQIGSGTLNLYNLPWSVRGLVNDLIYIKNVHSRSLIKNLIMEYRRWKPVSRQWKDVKNCFAAFEEVSVDDIFV